LLIRNNLVCGVMDQQHGRIVRVDIGGAARTFEQAWLAADRVAAQIESGGLGSGSRFALLGPGLLAQGGEVEEYHQDYFEKNPGLSCRLLRTR
jgi:hypothetical protein